MNLVIAEAETCVRILIGNTKSIIRYAISFLIGNDGTVGGGTLNAETLTNSVGQIQNSLISVLLALAKSACIFRFVFSHSTCLVILKVLSNWSLLPLSSRPSRLTITSS